MTILREFASRLRGLFAKDRRDAELEDELSAHLDMIAQEHIRNGMPPQEAHQAARREFGAVEQIKEAYRDRRGLPMLETFLQDLRYGTRMLRKNPGFTSIAVLTLALGIGATTAIFSVVNAVLLTPPNYKQPGRIVVVWENHRSIGHPTNVVSPANFQQWQEHNSVFEQMAATYDGNLNLTGDADPEQVPYQAVTTNLFTLLGAEPMLGRTFSAEDGTPGKDDFVILSYGLWQRRFGGDRAVIGKAIQLNGRPNVVIGVMPRAFQLFVKESSFTGERAQMWIPIAFSPRSRVPAGRYLTAIARLKPGVTVDHAQAQMDSLASALAVQWPDFDRNWGITLVPMKEQLVRGIRPALLVLLGAVGFVLLMACTNVANLLLARSASRQKELAIRAALGAGRKRIARQLLTESLLLATLGGTIGIMLAAWGGNLLLALSPKNLLVVSTVSVDWRVLTFTIVISILTGALFGLGPSLVAPSLNVNATLKEGGRDTSGGARGNRLRSALVVVEMSLAVVLLVGAGLCIRSLMRLRAVDPGFNPHNLLTMKLSLPNAAYPKDEKRIAFFQDLLARTSALPGVRSASADSWLPFTTDGAATGFQIEGRPAQAPADRPVTDVRVIEPNYFRTMGIPLLAGREFSEREATVISHVVIINETLARNYFPNEDPIGKRITIDMKEPKDEVPSLIVGVAADVKQRGLDTTPNALIYWPHPELAYSFMVLVIRTDGNPLSYSGAIREQLKQMDPSLPVSDIATMEDRMADSMAQTRFSTLLLGVFAAVAITLAAIGIYGVTSYAVSSRTHEVGIRMALGAQSGDVERMFIREGMILSLLGLVLGLVAAVGLSRFLVSQLFNVSPNDPVTFGVMGGLLFCVALLAAYIPARRATHVDPLIALRYE